MKVYRAGFYLDSQSSLMKHWRSVVVSVSAETLPSARTFLFFLTLLCLGCFLKHLKVEADCVVSFPGHQILMKALVGLKDCGLNLERHGC